MVLRGDLDVYLDDATEIENGLDEYGFDKKRFVIKPLLDLNLYLGFAPDAEGNNLRDTWDNTMLDLHRSGELKEIYESSEATDYYPFD